MLIYLMRHGAAQLQAESDQARQLTPQGRADNQAVLAKFTERSPCPDRCLVSPYIRAEQTAQGLLQEYPQWCFSSCELLTPEADLQLLLSFMDSIDAENLLMVGHNPLLSDLLNLLVSSGRNATTGLYLGTSALACVSCDVLAPACGKLSYLLEP